MYKIIHIYIIKIQLLNIIPTLQPSTNLKNPKQFTKFLITDTYHSKKQPQPIVLKITILQ